MKVETLDIRMYGIQCNYTNCYFNISRTSYAIIYSCITDTIRLDISRNWVSNAFFSQIIWGGQEAERKSTEYKYYTISTVIYGSLQNVCILSFLMYFWTNNIFDYAQTSLEGILE